MPKPSGGGLRGLESEGLSQAFPRADCGPSYSLAGAVLRSAYDHSFWHQTDLTGVLLWLFLSHVALGKLIGLPEDQFSYLLSDSLKQH